MPTRPPARPLMLMRALALSCPLCGPVPVHADSAPRTVFADTSPAVLPLTVVDAQGNPVANLSAVSLGDGRFVSHCGEVTGRYEARSGSTVISLALTAKDPDSPLCLLDATDAPPLPAVRTTALPDAGTRVFALGNALGLGIGITEGVVSKLHLQGDDERIQFTAAIASGSEGGGLFDDEGRLVGIIDRQLEGGQNVNLAVPATRLPGIAERAAARSTQMAEHDALLAAADDMRARQDWAGLLAHTQRWTVQRPQDAEAFRARAEAAEFTGDAASAQTDYEKALALDAGLRAAAFGLYRVQLARSDPATLTTALRMTELWPSDVDAWLALARAHAARSDFVAAEKAARHALQMQPWYLPTHAVLAVLARARGDVPAWLQHRREIFELMPRAPWALIDYADALIAAGRPARALALIAAYPDHDSNGDLIYFRARALAAAGRPAEALPMLHRSLQHAPRAPAWVWASIGDIAYSLGMWTQSIEAYRKAVELAPQEQGWRWKLALALKDAYQFDEAMSLFRAWTESRPDSADGWRQVGFVHGYRGEHAAGIVALERSLKLEPRQSIVWHVLIEYYAQSGRADDVRRAWATLRELDPARAEQARLCCIVPLEIVQ